MVALSPTGSPSCNYWIYSPSLSHLLEISFSKYIINDSILSFQPEKKLELEAKMMYEETKMRKRSVGNIRFIGELYKLRMLTSPIMMRIIGTLLERGDEESLECLCKLLTTIGKILEAQCGTQQKAMV